ncbi:MAG: hypoxanthine phosphoribosyltransferase [Candidatus Abyssobacteria bacterium SURF_17]|uniref:Hypoxanthine phosphoribosyltransferase n=1 Tax=Candidatus Abyssobacteria bacterium SURF_17 TaxID=2093361 RepID=A0A419ES59_9BACT|nr:MAG: hypoxanthine phosphoribosyltransferase [Candidatus Abyssubacteria bacterium SURF_17]
MSEANERLKELISEQRIAEAVQRLAAEIRHDVKGRTPVLIGVLKGAFMFMADLVRVLGEPVELDFIRISTYGRSDSPIREPTIACDITLDVKGRDVIVVEDIVDTGSSLNYLVKHLAARCPRSLKIAALIDKRGRRHCEVKVDYVGIPLECGFIVGYGIDYAERYRYLPAICELKKKE